LDSDGDGSGGERNDDTVRSIRKERAEVQGDFRPGPDPVGDFSQFQVIAATAILVEDQAGVGPAIKETRQGKNIPLSSRGAGEGEV
jgi:hypothetical protein